MENMMISSSYEIVFLAWNEYMPCARFQSDKYDLLYQVDRLL